MYATRGPPIWVASSLSSEKKASVQVLQPVLHSGGLFDLRKPTDVDELYGNKERKRERQRERERERRPAFRKHSIIVRSSAA